ncbi:MAG: DeoR/GlpR family DNA-binding transcription regulator [Anaerolineae bacterium]
MSATAARLIGARSQDLLRFIEERGQVSVSEVCERFSISEATARRHLALLAERGEIERVHGGAIAAQQISPDLPLHERSHQEAAEKVAIGRAAAALIGDGETVFLGSGTTVYQIALNIQDRKGLTVITNSVPVITALSPISDITLICLGGILRHTEMSLIGHISEMALSQLRADKVIIGVRAVDLEHGLTNDYLPETTTDRAILGIGREIIIAADYSKCGRVSTSFVAPLRQMHTFVTDWRTPTEFVDALRQRGIRVVRATQD